MKKFRKKRANLEERLKKFEQTLAISLQDSTALEKKENDPDDFRLLGEVKYALQDYEGSANAYRSASMASKSADFKVRRGLTNALLASKKPDQVVKVLVASRVQLDKEKSSDNNDTTGTSSVWIPFK